MTYLLLFLLTVIKFFIKKVANISKNKAFRPIFFVFLIDLPTYFLDKYTSLQKLFNNTTNIPTHFRNPKPCKKNMINLLCPYRENIFKCLQKLKLQNYKINYKKLQNLNYCTPFTFWIWHVRSPLRDDNLLWSGAIDHSRTFWNTSHFVILGPDSFIYPTRH